MKILTFIRILPEVKIKTVSNIYIYFIFFVFCCAREIIAELEEEVRRGKRYLPVDRWSYEGWGGWGKIAEDSVYLAGLCASSMGLITEQL